MFTVALDFHLAKQKLRWEFSRRLGLTLHFKGIRLFAILQRSVVSSPMAVYFQIAKRCLAGHATLIVLASPSRTVGSTLRFALKRAICITFGFYSCPTNAKRESFGNLTLSTTSLLSLSGA